MNKKYFAVILFVLIYSFAAYSQRVKISFTGTDHLTSAPVRLDSVRVQNLTTFKDTVIRDPFVIDLGTTTGVEDGVLPLRTSLELSSNYSNPFTDHTRFQISTATSSKIEVELYSIVGTQMASYQMDAAPGNHEFMLDGRGLSPGMYILVARDAQHAPSVRVMKCGTAVSSLPMITYNGSINQITGSALRKTSSLASYRFIGYAATYIPDSVLAAPTKDTTIQFRLSHVPTPPVMDFFTGSKTNVLIGESISFEVKSHDVNGDLSKVFIDYNEDGLYDDSTVVTGADALVTFTYAFTQTGSFRPKACVHDARVQRACKQIDRAITVVSMPSITTTAMTNITSTTSTSGGTITSDGGSPITARGVCWSTSPSPTILDNKTSDGTGMGNFVSNLTGLTADTKYYVRAYATNSAGTGYGSEVSFTTQKGGGGNTVTIGTQVWMNKDLDVTTYRNGDPIPQVTDPTQWKNLTTGAWCYYNNDPATGAVYGKLYNWYAVNDPRGLAPAGWHVPTDAEWKALEMSLGMSQSSADSLDYRGKDEAGKMKEAGNAHWADPNEGATNSSGFTALGSGFRFASGGFSSLTYTLYFWTASANGASLAWFRNLDSDDARARRKDGEKKNGFSVRCVKD